MRLSYYSGVLNEQITINSLLSSNAKLLKSVGALNIRIVGLALSPANSSGIGNLCGGKSAGCEASCVLVTAGRAAMPTTQRAAQKRTALFFDNRALFWDLLEIELGQQFAIAKSDGFELGMRFNVASDNVLVETMRPQLLGIADRNYDYTAIYKRALRSLEWNHNYHLTFSVKEYTPVEKVRTILDNGGNVAVVIDTTYNPQHKKYGALPSHVEIGGKVYATVDGDIHDLRRREVDGSGVVVLLRTKGHNRAKSFARQVNFAKSIGKLSGVIADTPTTIDRTIKLDI